MATKIYKTIIVSLIVTGILTIAFVFNLLIEGLLMMSCFLWSKRYYRYKYHCQSAFHCMLLSILVFSIGLRVTLPIGYSYMCCAICGLVIAYIFQYIAQTKHLNYEYELIVPEYNKLLEEKNTRNVYSMPEEELRLLCRKHLLDEIDEEIVVQRVIHRLKGKDLYSKIGYSKPQMIRREKRIEQKLNLKLKDR